MSLVVPALLMPGSSWAAGGASSTSSKAAQAITDTPASDAGKSVLDKARPSVVQLRAYFRDNTEKSSHGSGFVVRASTAGDSSLAITNYHVVSDLVMHPDKYRLEYRTPDDRTGRVELMAFDVRHDVALVRLVGHAPPALELVREAPAKGERAYSVGFALDVGLTITEGVSNGTVEDAFDERLHYAGALNPGMSGGPAFDARGRAIGVNVSAYRFEQNVSFFVPARHAAALLDRAGDAPIDPKGARAEVARQLHAHAKDLLGRVPSPWPVHAARGVNLPSKPAAFFGCGAGGDPDEDDPVQRESSQCAAKAGIYIADNVVTGDIAFGHHWLSTKKLDALRFTRHVQRSRSFGGARARRGWGRSDFGPNTCTERFVANQGVDLLARVCTRAYRKFEGLFDLSLSVTSSHRGREAFVGSLDLTGVPFEPGLAMIERWLAAIRPAADVPATAGAPGHAGVP
jgi:S1-C subfamily serine protease